MGATDITPKWLKAELFEELLKQTVDGYKQIKSFRTVAGTPVGEVYATVMLRLEFEIQLLDDSIKKHSFMMKIPHHTDFINEPTKCDAFIEENAMYVNIVPELEQLYRDVGVEVKFGANAYEIQVPVDYVLLENLTTKGFKNVYRLDCLDVEHTECVLRKLAQWHAASAVRVATKGLYPANLTDGFYKSENRSLLTKWQSYVAKPFFEGVKCFEGHEAYLEQIEKIHPTIIDDIIKLTEINPNEFNVLNHGDLWSGNIMFQYDDSGKIKETYLIDYESIKYGSIAQDLYYFLLSSTKEEYKLSKFDHFIKYYHDNLIEHLQLLKYNKPFPKLRDVHATLLRYSLWGLMTVVGIMGAALVDPRDDANADYFFSDCAEGEDFRRRLYGNPRYRKHVEKILPWLLNRGAFEIRQS